MLLQGDCLEKLKTLKANSVDALVTDPPAGISFMGKDWDKDKGGRDGWISWMQEVMSECHRVMKPGAHGLVWAIPRTSHWTATALENAGFEIRDVVTHLFGSGFPKSMNISIAIDKQAGAMKARGKAFPTAGRGERIDIQEGSGWTAPNEHKPITSEAKQWQGFGTALKPASEHWILIRKPCSEKTVAKNVLKWGVGGLNIDGSRIATSDNLNGGAYSNQHDRDPSSFLLGSTGKEFKQPQGRFPANLVLSHTLFCTDTECEPECAVGMLDRQSGILGNNFRKNKAGTSGGGMFGISGTACHADSGGASRFFYCAKASKRERNAGLEGMPGKEVRRHGDRAPDVGRQPQKALIETNHHPTVKPQKLMEYLITLITPPNGLVLDPFMGSGSTGVAAKKLGFKFIGIEKEQEYFEIAKRRAEQACV